MRKLPSAKAPPGLKKLAPVRPNAGIDAWYQKNLDDLVKRMHKSVLYWLRSAYRNNEPVLAQDELPSVTLQRAVRRMRKRWEKQFAESSPKMAKFFAKKAEARSSLRLQQLLREAGMSVKFTMTQGMRDVMNATISEQVGLIKTIPAKYFESVEVQVMDAVRQGGNLGELTNRLQKNYGVSRRRAAFIAKDQNNKATASMTFARQTELGIDQAIWMHSHGGKTPRPTHLANDGQVYDVKTGWYDPDAYGKGQGAWIRPGELINCRCVSSALIPGFD